MNLIIVLMFFHQLRGASGLDSEEIGHSTLVSSSEMSIEVSLIIVGNMADVMMILSRKFIIKEAYFFILCFYHCITGHSKQ